VTLTALLDAMCMCSYPTLLIVIPDASQINLLLLG
jgi:hypothetical protein